MEGFLVLAGAACFLVGFVHMIDSTFSYSDREFIFWLSTLVTGILLLIFTMVGVAKCAKQPWIVDDKPYSVEHIVSLGDNNMTNGRYYMRRGYIESDLYYQYMVDIGGGGFKANKVRSNNTTLYYDTDNYRVEWYTRTKKWLCFTDEETIYKIYIPEGSITDDYSVDLR